MNSESDSPAQPPVLARNVMRRRGRFESVLFWLCVRYALWRGY